MEAACSVAKAAAEVPANGKNPVPSAEELTFSHGVLAFMTCFAFQACFHGRGRPQLLFLWRVSSLSFHGVCHLVQVRFHGVCRLRLCAYGVRYPAAG